MTYNQNLKYADCGNSKGYDIIANFVMSALIDGKLTDREEHKLFDYLCKEIEIDIKKNKENKNE